MSSVLKCIVLSLICTSVVAAETGRSDAPFGLTEGMTREQLQAAMPGFKPDGEFHATAKSVPVPVPMFVQYGTVITPETGLCMLSANTELTSKSAELEQQFNELLAALTKKYGTPVSLDHTDEYGKGTPLIAAIDMEHRRLASQWEVKHSPGINRILLEAFSESAASGAVAVHYGFSNLQKCSDIMDTDRAKGL